MATDVEGGPEEGEERESEGEDQENPDSEGGEGEEDSDAAAVAKAAQAEARRREQHAGQVRRERRARAAAEARNEELQARIADLERRAGAGRGEDELLTLIRGLAENEDDPVGDIQALKRALKLYGAREAEATGQSQQQAAIEREVGKLRGAMTDAEEDFAIDNPDYYEAAKHYRDSRVEELRDAGYSGRYLDQKLADDLFGVVRMALESGQDPAERVYALAARRGFKPGAKKANDNLDKLGRAAESGVRPVARQPGGALSWGDVAKLDGAARDKAWAKLREREMKRGRA